MGDLIAHALATFLVVIDPLALAPLFIAMTRDTATVERRRIAVASTSIAAIVLIVFAFAGELLLTALGITLSAFRIAGGGLLFLLAIDMLFARHSGLRSLTSSEDAEAHRRDDVTVFPLAIPLIAGPGAISSVVLLMSEAAGEPLRQAVILGLMLFVLLLTLASLMLAGRIVGLLGVTGNNVVSRLLGIVLAALAVQFMLDGLGAVLASAGTAP